MPDPRLYAEPVVRCPLPGGAVFLDPRDPSIPFGYLAPELRGGEALRVTEDRARSSPSVPAQLAGSEEERESRAELAPAAGRHARASRSSSG